MNSESKQPRWQRRAEDRPREICAAALEVFAEKGFAAAKLDEIARRAGVSKGTLYLYFKDKEELFRAVVRDTVSPNVDHLRDALMSSELPFAQIVQMFLARLSMVAATMPLGRVVKMVIGESGNFPELARVWHDQVVSKALGVMVGLIEKAQAKGEVRPGDPRFHAFTLMGPMLMGLMYREVLQPAGGAPIDIEALARQHAETVLSGLLLERAE
jgi:AcrR family transcriptional regulator